MSRPLRLEFRGALYHVTSRGNARHPIYECDADRVRFLDELAFVVGRRRWRCHAYCLMGNHYHLVIETPEGGLSAGMQQLNSVYARAFNSHHGRVGHVLQGRFHAVVVDREAYLLELCRYVVLNPVRAGLVSHPSAWPWSSYRATVGLAATQSWLTTDWLLSQWGRCRETSIRRYARFVAEGMGRGFPWSDARGGLLLGGEAFVRRRSPALRAAGPRREIPRVQRLADRPPLASVVGSARNRADRNQALRTAYHAYGYTLAEIGREVGLHYATVSRIVSARRPAPTRRHHA